MRHADHDLTRAGRGRALDREVQHRHEHVVALDGEPLGAEVRAVEELLEALHLDQPVQQPALVLGAERAAVLAGFDRVPQPVAADGVLEVLVLVADRPAVRGAQPAHHVGSGLADLAETEHFRGDGLQLLG